MLLIQWILLNAIGIFIAQAFATYLSVQLSLGINVHIKDWFNITKNLMICATFQGLIFAGLQTIFLSLKLTSSRKILQWFISTVVCMGVGIVIPTIYGVLTHYTNAPIRTFRGYVFLGWLLSWVLAGLVWGAIAGRSRNQKIRWAILNAGAYLFWGLAGSLASNHPRGMGELEFFRYLIFIMVIFGIGMVLNGLIFQGLVRRYNYKSNN